MMIIITLTYYRFPTKLVKGINQSTNHISPKLSLLTDDRNLNTYTDTQT